MTVNKLRIRSNGSTYEVPTKDYVDNHTGGGVNSSQSINLSDMPVGYITWQMALMQDYLKLDGTNLANASTSYKELLDYAQSNNLITNDSSNKALFQYNDSTDVLTLPDYIGLVLQGGSTVEEKEAGLPNITGTFDSAQYSGYASASGAFYYNTGANRTYQSGENGASRYGFDASRSSVIYGNSTTVQPPAITLIPQIKYRKDTSNNVLYNDTPIGTIISYMGVSAPKDYLVCNGQTYNVVDYKELAEYIKTQFGSYNYFGGDGTTTFAVPDLRGEFLRGTGTNSHSGNGNGANVGIHQDATSDIYMQVSDNPEGLLQKFGTTHYPTNWDSYTLTRDYYDIKQLTKFTYTSDLIDTYTSRPTNTSVLYCIKYNTSVLSTPENNYSTEEQRIGTWIDGKPLYQRVFVLNDFLNISYTAWTETGVSIADNNILDVIFAVGYYFTNVDPVACYPMLATGNIAYRSSIALQTARNGSQDTINAFLLQYTKTTD